MAGDKSNRSIASDYTNLLSHSAFLGTFLFVSLFPSISKYPNIFVLSQMALTMGVYNFHSHGCQILHCKCLVDLNDLQGRRNSQRLTLTQEDRTLRSWEKRQELWRSLRRIMRNGVSPSSVKQWVSPTQNHCSTAVGFPICTFKFSPTNPLSKLHLYSGSEYQLEGVWCSACRYQRQSSLVTPVTALWLSQPTISALYSLLNITVWIHIQYIIILLTGSILAEEESVYNGI